MSVGVYLFGLECRLIIYISYVYVNGKVIIWKHLKDLYQKLQSTAAGISLVPKLRLENVQLTSFSRMEHVQLTSFSRMRVDLAAQVKYCIYTPCSVKSPMCTQVLSKSVADAFAYFGDDATTQTEVFVRNFDRFFVLMLEAFRSGNLTHCARWIYI